MVTAMSTEIIKKHYAKKTICIMTKLKLEVKKSLNPKKFFKNPWSFYISPVFLGYRNAEIFKKIKHLIKKTMLRYLLL